MHARRFFPFGVLSVILYLSTGGGGASSVLAKGLAEDYGAYLAAVKAGAPADEIRRLAGQVYAGAPGDRPALKGPAAYNLAKAEEAMGERDAALAHFAESVELMRTAFGRDDSRLLWPYWDYGRALSAAGEDGRALDYLDLASRVFDHNEDGIDPKISLLIDLDRIRVASLQDDLRHMYAVMNRLESRLDQAGTDRPYFEGMVNFWRGKELLARKSRRAAAKRFARAIELLLQRFDESDETVLMARTFHLQALEEAGRSDEATAECVAIARARSDEENAKFIPLFRVQPAYPRGAIEIGQQGHVVVSLTVTPEGRTADWKIVESSPRGKFDRAALEAVKKFRYAPRIVDGKAVAAKDVLYRFTFEVED